MPVGMTYREFISAARKHANSYEEILGQLPPGLWRVLSVDRKLRIAVLMKGEETVHVNYSARGEPTIGSAFRATAQEAT